MEKNLQALNHQEKITVWSERIADCHSSGMSVKAWCEENDIHPSSYYKWQKKLFSLATQSAPQFAEVCAAPPTRILAKADSGGSVGMSKCAEISNCTEICPGQGAALSFETVALSGALPGRRQAVALQQPRRPQHQALRNGP